MHLRPGVFYGLISSNNARLVVDNPTKIIHSHIPVGDLVYCATIEILPMRIVQKRRARIV